MMAINPDAKMLPANTNRNSRHPRNAPTAPINFQSPAPNARSSTRGSNITSAKAAPFRAKIIPVHPVSVACSVTPTTNPGTVNQLGIFLERQSHAPATEVNNTVSIQMGVRGSILIASPSDSLLSAASAEACIGYFGGGWYGTD